MWTPALLVEVYAGNVFQMAERTVRPLPTGVTSSSMCVRIAPGQLPTVQFSGKVSGIVECRGTSNGKWSFHGSVGGFPADAMRGHVQMLNQIFAKQGAANSSS
eukprot:gnl/TRDRNA2_/TRDRNA2_60750_c0_seq1.p1 gnl/TRDRNA2_/TRDRNA2_60750_c0~~gnl/TRDRNA2_/TRDRNA2_60750_c0_seq1.p1  ORF type:complete len:103 (-),score=5.54 gnl/TRDRNA2_/TRDRNA2_60750_c0_seq1:164-472(-)